MRASSFAAPGSQSGVPATKGVKSPGIRLMRTLLIIALLAGTAFGQAAGTWKMSPDKTTCFKFLSKTEQWIKRVVVFEKQ